MTDIRIGLEQTLETHETHRPTSRRPLSFKLLLLRGGQHDTENHTAVVGIDPGAHGAIAVLDDTGQIIDVFDMPFTPRGQRQDHDQRASTRGDPRLEKLDEQHDKPMRALIGRRATNGKNGI